MYLVIDTDEADACEIPLLDPRDALMQELLADAVAVSAGTRIRVKEVE